jgi:hypothetical protein
MDKERSKVEMLSEMIPVDGVPGFVRPRMLVLQVLPHMVAVHVISKCGVDVACQIDSIQLNRNPGAWKMVDERGRLRELLLPMRSGERISIHVQLRMAWEFIVWGFVILMAFHPRNF